MLCRLPLPVGSKRFSLRKVQSNDSDCGKMSRVASSLGIKSEDDWYKVSKGQLNKVSEGKELLKKYGSLYDVMKNFYSGCWCLNLVNLDQTLIGCLGGLLSNLRTSGQTKKTKELTWTGWEVIWDFARRYKITREAAHSNKEQDVVIMDGWYNVSTRDFEKNYGKALLSQYSGSPIKAVVSLYPDHDWHLSFFKNFKANSHLSNVVQELEFINSLGFAVNGRVLT